MKLTLFTFVMVVAMLSVASAFRTRNKLFTKTTQPENICGNGISAESISGYDTPEDICVTLQSLDQCLYWCCYLSDAPTFSVDTY